MLLNWLRQLRLLHHRPWSRSSCRSSRRCSRLLATGWRGTLAVIIIGAGAIVRTAIALDTAPACGGCPRSGRSGGEGHPTGPRTGSTGSWLRPPRDGANSDGDTTDHAGFGGDARHGQPLGTGGSAFDLAIRAIAAFFEKKRVHSNGLTNGATVDRGQFGRGSPALGRARSAGSKRARAACAGKCGGAGDADPATMRSGQ
jgi:hypothetical protein